METLWILLIGFALGFVLITLIRLGQGKMANCPRCGKRYWVSHKKTDPVCKICGVPLKLEKTAARKASGTVKAGRKKR
ncbi:MAG: hypothetical protein ACOY40_10120 [Bacillota bacterium]